MAGPKLAKITPQASHSRPWFYFDASYYISQCLEAGMAPPIGGAEHYLAHYLSNGGRNGLSPNPLFDEDYYRRRYPEVARDVQLGRWASGFEHYANIGAAADFSPAWFFDGAFYKRCHQDLNDENLRGAGFLDRYTHYLLVGAQETRASHWTIQALMTLAPKFTFPTSLADLAAMVTDGSTVPAIFNPVFDYEWMREKYNWGRSVKPGRFVRHYLLNVRPQGLSPSPYFDEAFYLSVEPEIKAAVEKGSFASGYEHFLLHGINEWRMPFAAFDPRYYFANNMVDERRGGSTQSPFGHFLRNRGTRRLAMSPPLSSRDIAEEMGQGIYQRRCALNAPRLADLSFAPAGTTPDVSIVMAVRDNFEQTANCLISAVYSTKASIEVIVFDNASTDATRNLGSINPHIKYLRAEANVGFTIAVNRGAEIATGRMLLLLNNDIELTPGAIDLALARLEADRFIGAVGGKIVRMHGRLQEGGSLVWRDGTSLGYARDRDPLDGQVNFARDVDFCSGCFLATMRSDWQELGGFDEAFAPAYYEETDFCLRLWERGQRVVYDPRIVVWHFEFGTSSIREEPLALMRRNQRYFAGKHKAYLSKCLPVAAANIERARLRHVGGPRALFIEDKWPDPAKGMGFVRSARVAAVLAEACGLVSILGLHDQEWPAALPGDRQGRRIEVLTGINITNVVRFLSERAGIYDLLWLSRTHNLAHLHEWRAAVPQFFAKIRVVLDTEAIAATRRFAYAEQAQQRADLNEIMLEEFEHLEGVDEVCVVNQLDRKLLLDMLARSGLEIPVSVLGHGLEVSDVLPKFAETTDIVLAGAYSQPDGPNADALIWFDRSVRPLIGELPGLEFVIAGSQAAQFARAAKLQHPYRINSDPPRMADVYRTARIMVAPTRFAAGVPMKVHEAASHGVPVVMTELLANQLGWRREGIAWAPVVPEQIAAQIAALAMDEERWQRTQALQIALVEHDCDPAAYETVIHRIVGF